MNATLPSKNFAILIVDDEAGLRYGLETLLKKHGLQVFSVGAFDEAVAVAEKFTVDLALIDIRLKGGQNGIELLKRLKQLEPEIVGIMMTGYGSIETAVTSMKEGAADYILKPIDNVRLCDVVAKNLELRALKTENSFLRQELLTKYQAHHCITINPEMQRLLRQADKIKDTPVTALITGESGTGKEVLARYLHFSSTRGDKPFVSVNCAALSETLLLSELFGHEKGAFTGAIARKLGKFEIANQGTLFLDEIGDMSLDIQAKLLRVIEESRFERVGGAKTIAVDVRLLAATNKLLEQQVQAGKFREDLYYRIHIVRFQLPPLRRRKADIPLLAQHFLAKYTAKYHRHASQIRDDAMQALCAYEWPGNIRELENVINHAVLLSEGAVIGVDDLQRAIFAPPPEPTRAVDISKLTSLKDAVDDVVQVYEKELVQQMLAKHGFNKSQTARALAITRKTLAQKIEKYQL